jgi:hypothetical protein
MLVGETASKTKLNINLLKSYRLVEKDVELTTNVQQIGVLYPTYRRNMSPPFLCFMFFRNVGRLSTGFMALYPKRQDGQKMEPVRRKE